MKSYLYLFLSVFLLSSCSSDDEPNFTQETEEDIIQYLGDNNLTATRTESGLYYIIDNEGTGVKPTENSIVDIEFKGYFLDGTPFNDLQSATFNLPQIITGLKEGIQYFSEGGNGTLIIPSELAFGDNGNSSGTIPGGAVLIFDIKLIATYANYEEQNEAAILQYIEDNNLNAQKTDSGLYYVINNEGTGAKPTSNSNVTVAYKGYLLDGTIFDQSDSNGISFGFSQVIAGWTEGIQLFKEGGDGILLIPASLGYGASGSGSIPGGAVIIFDVNLISIN